MRVRLTDNVWRRPSCHLAEAEANAQDGGMGMEHVIDFGAGGCPPWAKVADLLAAYSYPVDIRMIDGELSFPNETPPEAWRELRIGTKGGMIAVRRTGSALAVVTWENADDAMRGAWHALTWAFAEAGNGRIMHAEGALSAAEFRLREPMPFLAQGPSG
jgi:hypothetical protein